MSICVNREDCMCISCELERTRAEVERLRGMYTEACLLHEEDATENNALRDELARLREFRDAVLARDTAETYYGEAPGEDAVLHDEWEAALRVETAAITAERARLAKERGE